MTDKAAAKATLQSLDTPCLILNADRMERIALRPGLTGKLPDLPLGSQVRILPNHACATGAQYDKYHVVRDGSDVIEAEWPRFGGW